jgi:hypothetical protein
MNLLKLKTAQLCSLKSAGGDQLTNLSLRQFARAG